MAYNLAIIGMGPTGLYTFQQVIEAAEPAEIFIFEDGPQAGVGMPYSAATCRKSMLANIASIEIPPLPQPYLDWMQSLPKAILRGYGIDPGKLDERQFTPRLLLGDYFRSQFVALVRRAEARGHLLHIHEETRITDTAPAEGRVRRSSGAGEIEPLFDQVVVATGHVFPEKDEGETTYYPSPWSGLFEDEIAAVRVGIMGTSLSSIDAAMAVAEQHGMFLRDSDGELTFERREPQDGLHLTLMSRSGVLPEADFYCPIPYEPLQVMTPEAVARIDAEGARGLLDRIFALFRDELATADPGWARAMDLGAATPDDFAARYFAARLAQDPFRWASHNLAEVERTEAEGRTVAWRYAILRMHEVVEDLVESFDAEDRDRFDAGLKRVFVDNYAAVPSESIRRLLALRDAGVLSILTLGEDYASEREETHTEILVDGQCHRFDTFIDARGQRALSTDDLPFPTLRDTLQAAGCEEPEVDHSYTLLNAGALEGRISFAAIPYLMHDRPFVQGITACAEIGATIGSLAARKGAGRRRRSLRAA